MCWRDDRQGRLTGPASATLVGLAQYLWWQPKRQGLWSGLAFFPLVEVGSVTVVAGRYASALAWSRLCSFGRRGIKHCVYGPIGKGVVLASPLFLWWAWVQTLGAGRKAKYLVSLCHFSFGRRGLRHCGGRPEMQGRWSGLASDPLVGVGSVNVLVGR
jgi:hypothetical protein